MLLRLPGYVTSSSRSLYTFQQAEAAKYYLMVNCNGSAGGCDLHCAGPGGEILMTYVVHDL